MVYCFPLMEYCYPLWVVRKLPLFFMCIINILHKKKLAQVLHIKLIEHDNFYAKNFRKNRMKEGKRKKVLLKGLGKVYEKGKTAISRW